MIRWLFQKCSPSLKKKASQRPDSIVLRLWCRLSNSTERIAWYGHCERWWRSFLIQKKWQYPGSGYRFLRKKQNEAFLMEKMNQLYQTAIQDLFHPYGRKTPENIIYVYPLGNFYKLGKLTISKEELLAFQKKWACEQFDPSEVFTFIFTT